MISKNRKISLAVLKLLSLCKAIQRNSTQWALLAIGVLLIAAMAHLPARADVPGIESSIRNIENEYDIEIHYNYNAKTYFPSRWLKAPISARGKQLPAQEVARVLPKIQQFLSVYPKRVLCENLKSIYLLSELEFYGKRFGASNGKSSLYIKSKGLDKGFTASFLIATMHSEFSSILLRNHSFPKLEWRKINRTDFNYTGDAKRFLGQPNLYGQDVELLRDGFVVKYAQATLENDFNMISRWLFTRRSQLKKLANIYPRIAAKKQLAIRFYRSIDQRMTFE